jgi:hypothetical protein
MRQMMMLGCAAAFLGVFALPAQADDDDDRRCGRISQNEWMSVADITARASALGLDVREVERDDGCFEVKGRDDQNRRVQLHMHPATAEVMHRWERSGRDDDDRDDDWDD